MNNKRKDWQEEILDASNRRERDDNYEIYGARIPVEEQWIECLTDRKHRKQ